jgi:hypothetical protein
MSAQSLNTEFSRHFNDDEIKKYMEKNVET